MSDEQARKHAIRTTEALQKGQLPHNEEIQYALEATKDVIGEQQAKGGMSQTAEDAKRWVDAVQTVIREKNPDESLQRSAYHASQAASAASESGSAGIYGSGVPMPHMSKEEMEGVRSNVMALARHVMTSSELRDAMRGMFELIRDILSDRPSLDASPYASQRDESTSQNVARSKVGVLMGELSREEKAAIAGRAQNFLVRMAEVPRIRSALLSLFDLYDELQARFRDELSGKRVDVNVPVTAEAHAMVARQEAQRLIERFFSGASLTPLWTSLEQLSRDLRQGLFGEAEGMNRAFLERSMSDVAWTRSDAWKQAFIGRVDTYRAFLRPARDTIQRIVDETSALIEAWYADKTSQRLAETTERLARDLFMDESGRAVFRPEALMELRRILVPVLVRLLNYVALPRISGSDESIDWALDNIIFRGRDVLPEQITIENFSTAKVATEASGGQDVIDSRLYLCICDIEAHLRDVSFEYQRKTFPRLSDVGTLDLDVGGSGRSGLKIEIWLKMGSDVPVDRVMIPQRVRCTVDGFHISNMKGKEHDMMYTFFRPVIESMFSSRLTRAVEDSLNNLVVDLDNVLVNLQQKASGIGEEVKSGIKKNM